MAIPNKKAFLSKYNIAENDFKKTTLEWVMLDQIHDQYVSQTDALYDNAEYLSKKINKALRSSIHSTKYRVKDPEHLIDKIIRKRIEQPNRIITIDNYESQITDLIGIRVLHLFKDDWKQVHEYINNTWKLLETPIAYVREGDITKQFEEKKCNIQEHQNKYRSVHYLINHIENKQTVVAEIQVRTIFEEAWSEIDHKVRYPNHSVNSVLSSYLDVFNRLAGSADEMGTFLTELANSSTEIEQKYKDELVKRDEEIAELKREIDNMKLSAAHKRKLVESVDKISDAATRNYYNSSYSYKVQPLFSLTNNALINIATASATAAATVQMLMPLQCHTNQFEKEREDLDISSAYQLHLKAQARNNTKK